MKLLIFNVSMEKKKIFIRLNKHYLTKETKFSNNNLEGVSFSLVGHNTMHNVNLFCSVYGFVKHYYQLNDLYRMEGF